jgi:hypothetical protein
MTRKIVQTGSSLALVAWAVRSAAERSAAARFPPNLAATGALLAEIRKDVLGKRRPRLHVRSLRRVSVRRISSCWASSVRSCARAASIVSRANSNRLSSSTTHEGGPS